METTVNFTVNGRKQTVTTDSARRLLDVLRENLNLTGTRYGCGEGVCGACTVLMDKKPVQSCLVSIADAEGKTITTIEGLAKGDSLHPVQQAFVDEGAMQCGYCTSGMILAASALLDENRNPSDEDIVAAMNGHICRCNGYVKIQKAIKTAAEKMRR